MTDKIIPFPKPQRTTEPHDAVGHGKKVIADHTSDNLKPVSTSRLEWIDNFVGDKWP